MKEDDPIKEPINLLEKNTENNQVKLYKRRWIILTIFVLYQAMNLGQWTQYSIITNIVMKYYNVRAITVDCTSIIFMVVYFPLIIPFSYIVDKMGLRVAALLGALGTTLGSIIKLFSVSPSLMWVTFIGQLVSAVSSVFILSLSPKVAAVWFGPNEVSTACALGVFGMQLGTAIGFFLPTVVVKNHNNIEDIGNDLNTMFWIYAGIMIPISIFVIAFFQAQPKLPPSHVQLLLRNKNTNIDTNFLKSIKTVFYNRGYLLHVAGYGINIGVYCAVSTMLNQFILSYFPNSEEDVGLMALLMTILGMIGGVACGIVLDKTRKYKLITSFIYIMTALCFTSFMFALETQSKTIVYFSICTYGLFINAYISIGYELSTELTYPASESTTSGILLGVSQAVAVIFTLFLGKMLEKWGTYWSVFSQVCFLFVGTIFTLIIPNNMKRQEAFKKEKLSRREALLQINNSSS